jgi:hypothetical protein
MLAATAQDFLGSHSSRAKRRQMWGGTKAQVVASDEGGA